MIRVDTNRRIQSFLSPIAAFVLAAALLASTQPAGGADIDFARDVAPLLEAKCIRCHNPGNAKGDLSLATADDVAQSGYVVAGKPEASELLRRVTAEDEGVRMPPEGPPLTATQVDLLRRWIAEGAAIHVCGSLEGMAPGVHAVLVDVLGAATVESLQAEGRYRRDVY